MPGFLSQITQSVDQSVDEIARRRASQKPAAERNSISPERSLLLRVAAQGEAGAQGFQRQRDAQAQQDSAVREAAATGMFPIGAQVEASRSGGFGNTRPTALDRSQLPTPSPVGGPTTPQRETNLPLNERIDFVPPSLRPEPTVDEVASSPFSSDEDIARALLGIPQGVDMDLGVLINDLDRDEQSLFFQAFNELLDFQDRRTQQANEQARLQIEQQRAEQDRFAQQLLTAKQLDEAGFSDAQIIQATGISPAGFDGSGGLDARLDQLEQERAQSDRALSLLDFDSFSRGGLGQAGQQAGLASEAEANSGATAEEFLTNPTRAIFGDTDAKQLPSQADLMEFTRSDIGRELEFDIRGELEAGTPFREVAKAIQDFGLAEDLPEEIINALINDWAPAFAQRTVALQDLLNGDRG